ncbi:putative bifunctional diguanylate cyclase/phosphodiesterase [Thalassorhabdomicrobium marinisediminis]|uniref:putative bifunctional diguanylate cyclase/phosphodiesterase n=1 Tax=Thalassorhabdomicrobium marinisediminis TaxID=2170577 RepID=UPI002492B593|nr:EAL domain-containing protein [Thalassorhabdomicrobium marinisediminis]
MSWCSTPATRGRLERFLDVIASRRGMASVLGVLLITYAGAAMYGHSMVEKLEQTHAVFRDAQLRNGYVAMSDVQRLVTIAQSARNRDEMTEADQQDFIGAADIIFVRVDHFSGLVQEGNNQTLGALSVAALREVLDIADRATADGFADLPGLASDLLVAAEDTRSKLVLFLDEMRRQSDDVLAMQSTALRQQQRNVLITLAGLTLLSWLTLMLLRREVLGRQARDVAERKVAFLAYNDALTGLPNRTQYKERLERLLAEGQDVALLLADLDEFKSINDTFGHGTGDAVLRFVAQKLAAFARRHSGFAARLGGDEFALVVPTTDLAGLIHLCEGILRSTAKPVDIDGEAVGVGISIGLATTELARDTDGATIDLLSRIADFALYEAKSAGRNRFAVYDSALEVRFLERRAMVEDLPNAVSNRELSVYLQPKVDLATATPTGFEALVRWQRAGRLTPPDEFVQVAEETGMIQRIDRYVLNEATRAVAQWNMLHETAYAVSVNLSGLHFTSSRLVDWVREALEVSGLRADLLTLEITETVQLRDWKLTGQILAQLRALGVRISIDDFGTGYSSLAYLRAIMADELKIDRSLVTQIDAPGQARMLFASVLDIARTMELDVVVEGVETADQVAVLTSFGVKTVQGFYFGRPAPMAQALRQAMETPATGVTAPRIAS